VCAYGTYGECVEEVERAIALDDERVDVECAIERRRQKMCLS
jgi:hypothetical protein